MKTKILITCEHAGNQIPGWLAREVEIPQKTLESHVAYDKGAMKMAKEISRQLKSDLFVNKVTRLLIDYNRSITNKHVWGKYSQCLSEKSRLRLLKTFIDYRNSIKKKLPREGIHLAVHSFTPKKNGVQRNCDFSILYDPARKKEKEIAKRLKKELIKSGVKCRLNYPYLGKTDGLATSFRKEIGLSYVGFELEFNQKIVNDREKTQKILEVLKRNFTE
ncbi:MAG: N-formylglutamate amidohydrolase [Halobacteriovoraceae bacterium]|nr:N-formylglutamate amidohydrolase [Halobacteriovoraceae bacterium]